MDEGYYEDRGLAGRLVSVLVLVQHKHPSCAFGACT